VFQESGLFTSTVQTMQKKNQDQIVNAFEKNGSQTIN
jgi:hypothetical protein